MIVNPQLFNYRLIIGSLVIVIVILGSYSYYSFNALEDQKAFIKQENQLVQNELSKMIDNYKTINVKNDRTNLKLEGTKNKLNRIIDSIEISPENASLITHYKTKAKAAKKNSENTLTLLDAYKKENTTLKNKLKNFVNKDDFIIQDPSNEAYTDASFEKISPISINTSSLINKNEKAKNAISIRNIKAQGVKKVTSKNRIINTRIASKANQLHISFTIPKSELVDSSNKNVYIQIVDSNNNIVGDKGSVSFGNRNLIYSKKTIINHEKESVKISTLIKANRNEPLIKGSYLVNVFHNATRIANTTINLK